MTTATPRTTRRGTPCAQSWDEDWIEFVERRESEMGRRICGARTVGGRPCLLPSEHASGRCRHHGGFPLTGASPDNRNGIVHGLYSRRLMICGTHCPAWQSCPMGGGASVDSRSIGGPPMRDSNSTKQLETTSGDGGLGFQPERAATDAPETAEKVGMPRSDLRDTRGQDAHATSAHHGQAARVRRDNDEPFDYGRYLMRLPAAERPICPYEQVEYQAVVTDVQRRTCAHAGNAMGVHVAHTVALLTVMVSRAARALAMKPFTEKFEQSGENFYSALEKPSAALVAFEKIQRELRQWMRLVEHEYSMHTTPDRAAIAEHKRRQTWDTNPDPDAAAVEPESAKASHDASEPGDDEADYDEYDEQENVDGMWAAIQALDDLLNRTERPDPNPPPKLPRKPPRNGNNNGPAP